MYIIRALHMDNKMEYWSNRDGWTHFIETADFFTEREMLGCNTPMHWGEDVVVEWISISLPHSVVNQLIHPD